MWVFVFMWFKKIQDIERQIDDFVAHKASKSVYTANSCREWLLLFKKNTGLKNVYMLDWDEYLGFEQWLYSTYSSRHFIDQAQNAIKQFLRYYRHDIMREMSNVGRPINVENVLKVKKYREAGLTFREIQAVFEKKGKKHSLPVIFHWANYPLKKLEQVIHK